MKKMTTTKVTKNAVTKMTKDSSKADALTRGQQYRLKKYEIQGKASGATTRALGRQATAQAVSEDASTAIAASQKNIIPDDANGSPTPDSNKNGNESTDKAVPTWWD